MKLNPFDPCLGLSNKVLDILVSHRTARSSKLKVKKNLELEPGHDAWCRVGRVVKFFQTSNFDLRIVTGKVVIESILLI